MIRQMNEKEWKIFEKKKERDKKKSQLIFILKNNKELYIEFEDVVNKLEDDTYIMSDKELDSLYKLFEEEINKEIWIEIYFAWYHISEFDEMLKNLVEHCNYSKISTDKDQIDEYLKSINKTRLEELTIDEKSMLYFILNPIKF